MDESQESMLSSDATDTVDYKQDEVVWVKLGTCWWPGEVQDPDNLPTDILPSKKPPYTIVKFFNEDKYEFIKKSNHITKYLCERKNEFIRRGLDMHRSKNMFMDKFPVDVSMAESKTGGDPGIITSEIFLPENRKSVPKFGIFPTRKTSKKKTKRKTAGISNMLTPKTSTSQLDLMGQYVCDFCYFSSDRINNIVTHLRYHFTELGSVNNILKVKNETAKKRSKLQSHGRISRSLPIQSTNDLLRSKNDIFGTERRRSSATNRKTPKRRSKLSKNTKNETVKVQGPLVEDLVKEWDDDDDFGSIPDESDTRNDDSVSDTDSCTDIMKMDSCIRTDHLNDEESEEQDDTTNNDDEIGMSVDSEEVSVTDTIVDADGNNMNKLDEIDEVVEQCESEKKMEIEVSPEPEVESTEIKDDNDDDVDLKIEENVENDNCVDAVNYNQSSEDESTLSLKPRLRTSKRPLHVDELSKNVDENFTKSDRVIMTETSPVSPKSEPRLRTSRRITKQNTEKVNEEDVTKIIKQPITPKLRSSKRLSHWLESEEIQPSDEASTTVPETPKLRTSKRIRKIDNEETPKVEEYGNEIDKCSTDTKLRVSKRLQKSTENVIEETKKLLDETSDDIYEAANNEESKLKTSKKIQKLSVSKDEHDQLNEPKLDDSKIESNNAIENSKNVTNEKFKIIPTTKLRSSKIHCSSSFFDVSTTVQISETDVVEKQDLVLPLDADNEINSEVQTTIDQENIDDNVHEQTESFVVNDNDNVAVVMKEDDKIIQQSIEDAKTECFEEKSLEEIVFNEISSSEIENKTDLDEVSSVELKTFDEPDQDKIMDVEDTNSDQLVISDIKSPIEDTANTIMTEKNEKDDEMEEVESPNVSRRTSKRTLRKRVDDLVISEIEENSAKKSKKTKTLSAKKKVVRKSTRKSNVLDDSQNEFIDNENESVESNEIVETEIMNLPIIDDVKEEDEIIDQIIDENQELKTVTSEDDFVKEFEESKTNEIDDKLSYEQKDENNTEKLIVEQSEIIDKTEISNSDESKIDKFNFSMDYTEIPITESDAMEETNTVTINESLESKLVADISTETSDKNIDNGEKGNKLKLIEYKIITAAGNIVDAKSYDFNAVKEGGEMLDISSMPIVVSDDNIAVTTSSKVEITSSAVTVTASETSLTYLPLVSTKTASVTTATTSTAMKSISTSSTVKNLNPSRIPVPSYKTLHAAQKLPKIYKDFSNKNSNKTVLLTQPGKPGQFVIVPSTTSSTSTGTKYTVGKNRQIAQQQYHQQNQTNQSQPTQILTSNATTLMFLTGPASNQIIVKGAQNNITASPTLITEDGKIVALQNATLKSAVGNTAALNQKTLVVRNVLKGQPQSHLVQTMPTSTIVKQRLIQQPVTYQQIQPQRIIKNTSINSNNMVNQKQQLKKIKKPVTVPTTATNTKLSEKKQSLQYVVHDYMGNKIVLHEGQIIAYPSEVKLDEQPAFYIFKVENCNLVPLSDEVMKSMEEEIKNSVPGRILSSNQIVKMPKVIKEVVADNSSSLMKRTQQPQQSPQKPQRTATNSMISYNGNENVDTMIIDEPILITDDGKKLIYTESGYMEAPDDMDLSAFLMRTKESVVETVHTASVPLIEEEIVLDNNHYFIMENNNVDNTVQVPSTKNAVDQKHDILAAALADSDMLFATSTVTDNNSMNTSTSSTVTGPIMATRVSSDYVPNKDLSSITTEIFEANDNNSKNVTTISMPSLTDDAHNITSGN